MKPKSETIDADLLPVLRKMETTGVKLDVGHLETLALDLRSQLEELEQAIYSQVGHPFRITSPKQLGEILFSELKLAMPEGGHLRKTSQGFSTDAHQLEKLAGAHPVIDLVLKYRELGKLLSTYVEPLPTLVDADHRLHTHYAPDAASGRLSSRKPNLQNIPARTELGRKIRQAFIAQKGFVLLSADYSQLQLRIIAELAGDKAMQAVFQAGGDIHATTSEALQVDRRTAKAVNFGIIYGLTAFGLAESLKVSREDAEGFITRYFETYPDVHRYLGKLVEDAHQKGYTTTMFGKRRPLPELASANDFVRRAGERIAMNHPIQGAEADIMKLAMIQVDQALEGQSDCLMILQVHDELVFEVKEHRVEDYWPKIKKLMETTVSLSVPLPVEGKIGTNWAEMKAL